MNLSPPVDIDNVSKETIDMPHERNQHEPPPDDVHTWPKNWPIKRRMSDPYDEHIDENGNWCVDDRVLEDYYIMPWEEPDYVDEPLSNEALDACRKTQEAFDRKWEEISRFANNRFAVLDSIRAIGNIEPLKNNHDGGNRPKPDRN